MMLQVLLLLVTTSHVLGYAPQEAEGTWPQPSSYMPEDFVFTLPDIVTHQMMKGSEVQLEAFPSTRNSLIMTNKQLTDEQVQSKLHWVSVGYPMFTRVDEPIQDDYDYLTEDRRAAESSPPLFRFADDVIYAYIETLTEQQRSTIMASNSFNFKVYGAFVHILIIFYPLF